jgi:hypothetical protein
MTPAGPEPLVGKTRWLLVDALVLPASVNMVSGEVVAPKGWAFKRVLVNLDNMRAAEETTLDLGPKSRKMLKLTMLDGHEYLVDKPMSQLFSALQSNASVSQRLLG